VGNLAGTLETVVRGRLVGVDTPGPYALGVAYPLGSVMVGNHVDACILVVDDVHVGLLTFVVALEHDVAFVIVVEGGFVVVEDGFVVAEGGFVVEVVDGFVVVEDGFEVVV